MEHFKMLYIATSKKSIESFKQIVTQDDCVFFAETLEEVKSLISRNNYHFVFVDIDFTNNELDSILDYISNRNVYYNEIYALTDDSEKTLSYLEKYRLFDYIVKPFAKEVLLKKINGMKSIITIYKGIEERLDYMNKNHLDAVSQLNPDIFATFRVNASKDILLDVMAKHIELDTNMTASYALNEIAKNISDIDARERYIKDFSMQTLLNKYKLGQTAFSRTDLFEFVPGIIYSITTKVNIFTNPITNDVEVVASSYDVTRSYEAQVIQAKLLNKRFNSIAIIRLADKKIKVFFQLVDAYDFDSKIPYDYTDYYTQMELVSSRFIPEDSRESFINKSNINTIVKALENKDYYSFTTKSYNSNNEIESKQFSFFYADDLRNEIITTMQDANFLLEYDEISKSYNSKGFVNHASNVLAKNATNEYALLFFDLIGFKAINEMFGTQFADRILADFPNALDELGLYAKVLGRIEADHFVCLMDRKNLNIVKLNELLHSNVSYGDKSISISARCGIYLIQPNEYDVNAMISHAKLANECKNADNLKSYHFYSHEMKEDYLSGALSHFDLERALFNKEFKVYYQPVFDPNTRKIMSAEALIRWQHPVHGMISPAKFIPALEKSGEISKIDSYVIKETIEMNNHRKNIGKRIIPISTNLSRMDLFDKNMLESLLTDINSNKMTDYIRLEITESVYSAITTQGINVLNKLKNQGTKFYIDDFGAGYSSFATITEYDFDFLKLDISLIRQIGTNKKIEKIIKSVIKMTHDMELKIVAEGVETEEQLNFLRECECDLIQGYYFSKPLDREAFEKLLDDNE